VRISDLTLEEPYFVILFSGKRNSKETYYFSNAEKLGKDFLLTHKGCDKN